MKNNIYYIILICILPFLCCKSKSEQPQQQEQDIIASINYDTIPFVDDSDVIYPKTAIPYSNKMYADNKISFQVEELTKPVELLQEDKLLKIIEDIIQSESTKEKNKEKDSEIKIDYNIRGRYNGPNKLVNYGSHSFFRGMYKAYADHRPFVLSPDIVWLLITQGFANHVNNNSEELRKLFVDFDNKAILLVEYDNMNKISWEDMFSEFPKAISKFTGDELINVLSNDFTTTTPITKTVSEITIMSSFEPYFEYWGAVRVCGIPHITLEGTPEDWEKVLKKAQYLKKYELSWWIQELEPILKKLIETSKGNIDKEFWKNIFKISEEGICSKPDIIDGWIVKFYPYLLNGSKTSLETLPSNADLPSEIAKVNLQYQFTDNTNSKTIPLEIWGGFIGLQQDKKTFALKPEIGWFVRKKDAFNPGLAYHLDEYKKHRGLDFTVKKVPIELLKIKCIDYLTIHFTEGIKIPDEMANIKISMLELHGEISEKEIKRLDKLFSQTALYINGKKISKNDVQPLWE